MAKKDNYGKCGVEECRGGEICYRDTNPDFNKTCKKCMCFKCTRATCPPSQEGKQ